MAENSKIEWCHHTFNAWVGCSKISPACDHCYAQTWARRTGHAELWEGQRRRTSVAYWKQPLAWDVQARLEGRRVRVFCASLADVFDNEVPHQWRTDLFELIGNTPHLDWLLLTKRIGNAHRMLDQVVASWSDSDQVWDAKDWPHVWLGATIANQEEADRDVPKLLATPAAVRFLSCEPLLGPINLTRLHSLGLTWLDALSGRAHEGPSTFVWDSKIDWVIAGGESGPKARPSHPHWFASLRDQCAAAGVPFHFKQHGEWLPECQLPPDTYHDPNHGRQRPGDDLRTLVRTAIIDSSGAEIFEGSKGQRMFRVGKQAAGRTLDGQVWDQFPEPQP